MTKSLEKRILNWDDTKIVCTEFKFNELHRSFENVMVSIRVDISIKNGRQKIKLQLNGLLMKLAIQC